MLISACMSQGKMSYHKNCNELLLKLPMSSLAPDATPPPKKKKQQQIILNFFFE